ncbi:MAG TPA: hypothetical protein VEA38_15260 [Terriglobales bacterium]|nr:hypothetical protein [Terriglobales bacterium]
MPYQGVPGARGVQWRPGEETFSDPKKVVYQGTDGLLYAGDRPGFWTKAAPWIVGGAIAAPHLYALATMGLAGAPAATTATAAGTGAEAAATGAGMATSFWNPNTLKLLELGVGAGTNLWSNRTANRAAQRAMDAELASNAETLAYLRERDARGDSQYMEERGRRWTQEDEDRAMFREDRAHRYKREGEREGRLAPLRGDSGAYRTLRDLTQYPISRGARGPRTLYDLASVASEGGY